MVNYETEKCQQQFKLFHQDLWMLRFMNVTSSSFQRYQRIMVLCSMYLSNVYKPEMVYVVILTDSGIL